MLNLNDQTILVDDDPAVLSRIQAASEAEGYRVLVGPAEAASAGVSDRGRCRDRDALDFRTMAAELKGPALRELVQLWLKRAEFNPATRELVLEIRRVPKTASLGSTLSFDTEGEGFEPPSPFGRRFSRPVH